MITRFRLEGESFSRDHCLEILANLAEDIWIHTNTCGADWVTTQEVIVKDEGVEIFHGRLVMKRKPPTEEPTVRSVDG